jgi:hypothetical protein
MGNAHVTDKKRMGFRPSREAEVVWRAEPFVFDSAEVGVAPGELVAEVHLDKLLKLEKVSTKWVVEDSFAAPKDSVMAEWSSPVTMETVTSFCSLPNPWPAGKYRVDIFLGDSTEVAGSLRFVITSHGDQLKSATLTHEGAPVEVIGRGFGPLRVVFESQFVCDVRENSRLEWWCGDSLLLKLDVPPGTHNQFHSDITLDQPWPPGDYRVLLILDGNLVHTKRFQCVDGWVGRVSSSTTPEGLFPHSGELSALFNIAAKQTVSERVDVLWMFEDGTLIAKISFEAGSYNAVNATVKLAPGTPWPVGSYAVELIIDGARVCKQSFQIKAQDQVEAKKM